MFILKQSCKSCVRKSIDFLPGARLLSSDQQPLS